ncbi:MAG: hypothetical protein A2Y41_01835 [Spirochaetes bacterium GWB1_36_13]|nr:MAG: hypothetical protein A2Y41_01835 [Spirochaetes bacterium GWB1_36_13]
MKKVFIFSLIFFSACAQNPKTEKTFVSDYSSDKKESIRKDYAGKEEVFQEISFQIIDIKNPAFVSLNHSFQNLQNLYNDFIVQSARLENLLSSESSGQLEGSQETIYQETQKRISVLMRDYLAQSESYQKELSDQKWVKTEVQKTYAPLSQLIKDYDSAANKIRIRMAENKRKNQDDGNYDDQKKDIRTLEKNSSQLREIKDLFENRLLKKGYCWKGENLTDYEKIITELKSLSDEIISKYSENL